MRIETIEKDRIAMDENWKQLCEGQNKFLQRVIDCLNDKMKFAFSKGEEKIFLEALDQRDPGGYLASKLDKRFLETENQLE